MSTLTYFTSDEVVNLDPGFVARLEWARAKAQTPFIITSGYRTHEECVALGTPNSAHQRGLAVDLHCNDSVSRFKIVKALLDTRFTRVEISERHIHVDCDDSLPQEVLWLGPDK